MYICLCNAVTERQVKECARAGARTVDELASELGVGAGCGRCRDCAARVLEETDPAALMPSLAALAG